MLPPVLFCFYIIIRRKKAKSVFVKRLLTKECVTWYISIAVISAGK